MPIDFLFLFRFVRGFFVLTRTEKLPLRHKAHSRIATLYRVLFSVSFAVSMHNWWPKCRKNDEQIWAVTLTIIDRNWLCLGGGRGDRPAEQKQRTFCARALVQLCRMCLYQPPIVRRMTIRSIVCLDGFLLHMCCVRVARRHCTEIRVHEFAHKWPLARHTICCHAQNRFAI